MAVGLSAALANDILDALCTNSALTTLPVAQFWIQLGTGDPGAAGTGTGNPAGNATRKQVTFGTASNGTVSNTSAITWTTGEVDTSEDYTHWTAWTASTSGTFLCSGTITANAVTVGDEFTIPVGDLDLSLNIAA
jgi:hypothetical protein